MSRLSQAEHAARFLARLRRKGFCFWSRDDQAEIERLIGVLAGVRAECPHGHSARCDDCYAQGMSAKDALQ